MSNGSPIHLSVAYVDLSNAEKGENTLTTEQGKVKGGIGAVDAKPSPPDQLRKDKARKTLPPGFIINAIYYAG